MIRWIAPAFLATLLFSFGCKEAARQSAPKTYTVRGQVIEVDAKKQEILLQHEAVPGFMVAMTMPYKVTDPAAVNELHANDKITATIVIKASGTELQDVVITGQAAPNTLPTVQYHVPERGDAVPDFHMTNQNGQQIHLSQFRGKVLLLTFIYTRCPLDDYCPRMSRNFAEIEHWIQTDRDLSKKTHLLSVSFDTAYDKPAVLRSYGEAYTGNYNKERFDHWDFAAPDAQTLAKMTQYFDVGVSGSDPQSIVHSLSTVIVGPDGKVVEWLPTNDWKPSDVLGTMRKAAV